MTDHIVTTSGLLDPALEAAAAQIEQQALAQLAAYATLKFDGSDGRQALDPLRLVVQEVDVWPQSVKRIEPGGAILQEALGPATDEYESAGGIGWEFAWAAGCQTLVIRRLLDRQDERVKVWTVEVLEVACLLLDAEIASIRQGLADGSIAAGLEQMDGETEG